MAQTVCLWHFSTELYIFILGQPPSHSLFDLSGFLFQNEFLVLFY